MDLRKERVAWLIHAIIKYDMNEIAERFYEILPTETNDYHDLTKSLEHSYDANWNMYDYLQPLKNNGDAQHV